MEIKIPISQNKMKKLLKWAYELGKQDENKFHFNDCVYEKLKGLGFKEAKK